MKIHTVKTTLTYKDEYGIKPLVSTNKFSSHAFKVHQNEWEEITLDPESSIEKATYEIVNTTDLRVYELENNIVVLDSLELEKEDVYELIIKLIDIYNQLGD